MLGDRVEAAGVTVIGITPFGLSLRSRHVLATAVFEDLVPVLAPLSEGGRPVVLVARSAPETGAVVAALGWREGSLVPVAETPAVKGGLEWVHVIGAANLGGDATPEVVAVRMPQPGGVLTAYRRTGAVFATVAQVPGFASHAAGSRNQDQALLADLDGNGRPEVMSPAPVACGARRARARRPAAGWSGGASPCAAPSSRTWGRATWTAMGCSTSCSPTGIPCTSSSASA